VLQEESAATDSTATMKRFSVFIFQSLDFAVPAEVQPLRKRFDFQLFEAISQTVFRRKFRRIFARRTIGLMLFNRRLTEFNGNLDF